jgi:hypothetical protein
MIANGTLCFGWHDKAGPMCLVHLFECVRLVCFIPKLLFYLQIPSLVSQGLFAHELYTSPDRVSWQADFYFMNLTGCSLRLVRWVLYTVGYWPGVCYGHLLECHYVVTTREKKPSVSLCPCVVGVVISVVSHSLLIWLPTTKIRIFS